MQNTWPGQRKVQNQATESAGDITGYQDQFRKVMNEAAELREKKQQLIESQKENENKHLRTETAINELADASPEIKEWDEVMIRQPTLLE